MSNKVKEYYNEIAETYDRSRFDNSYGEFIDKEERSVINRYVKSTDTIDIACGTGRFMNYCRTGIDISSKMLDVGRDKYPEKEFIESDIFSFKTVSTYDHAICFHLIMHLQNESVYQILDKVYDLLKPGGIFIFDVISAERRSIIHSNHDAWHGGNGYFSSDIIKYVKNKWKIREVSGILFLPIQRFPKLIRRNFLKLDQCLNATCLKKFSSYKAFVLEKK